MFCDFQPYVLPCQLSTVWCRNIVCDLLGEIVTVIALVYICVRCLFHTQKMAKVSVLYVNILGSSPSFGSLITE